MGAERVFVDTNVLVYATRPTSRMYSRATAGLRALEDEANGLCISRQVLREYLATITRPQGDAMAIAPTAAVADVRRFSEIYEIAEDGPEVTEKLLELVMRYPTAGKQIHDANIVATMLANDIGRLITFNASDFRRFGDVIGLVAP